MGDTTLAYRQGDYPISIDGTFAKRIQDYEVSKQYPRERVDQLGSEQSVGTVAESTDYSGRLRAYGIDNAIETALGGATPISWQNHTGSTVAGPTSGITAAKIVRAEYSCRVNGFFEESFDLFGTGWSNGSSVSDDVTGDIAFRAKDIDVQINGVSAVRAQSFRVTVDLRPTEIRELNNADIVGRVYDSPVLTCEVEYLESDNIAGDTEFTTSAGSIVILVDSTKKVLTMNNVRSSESPSSARVGDFGRKTLRYESDGNTADGGLTLS